MIVEIARVLHYVGLEISVRETSFFEEIFRQTANISKSHDFRVLSFVVLHKLRDFLLKLPTYYILLNVNFCFFFQVENGYRNVRVTCGQRICILCYRQRT